jgi:hypothetical protein
MRKLLLALLIILAAACRNQENSIPSPGPEGRWYQLEEGRLEAVSGPAAFLPVPFQPWTVQSRIADLASLGGEIFLAVNGHGLAALQPAAGNPGSSDRIRYFYDPTLFAHRTISTLIAEPETLLCHLYFNRILNTVPAESLLLQGISLVRHHPAQDVYELIIPPFQDRHPDWEAVGFLPRSRERFLLEWKYTDERETRFSYGLLMLNPTSEAPANRAQFRAGFDFRSLSEAPPVLRRLLKEAAQSLAPPHSGVGLHFLVRSAESPLIRRYAYADVPAENGPGPRLLTVHAVERGDRAWLLLPGGALLENLSGSEAPRRLDLPPLPPQFHYTDLFAGNSCLLLPWEQADFIQVGAAGLYIRPLSSGKGGG